MNNDFDIQLFAEGEAEGGSEGNVPIKIKVGAEEFSEDELISAIATAKSDGAWKKANTVAAQKNAEERRALDAERQTIDGWAPIIDRYGTDASFQQALDSLWGGGATEEINEFVDPRMDTFYRELAEIKAERAIEKSERNIQQQRDNQRIVDFDAASIKAKIKTSGDMFSYDDVEAFAAANEISMPSVAYEILRGSDANIAHHSSKAKAAALEEYTRKAPQRVAPNAGAGGLVGQEKLPTDFRAASREAAKEFNPYK